MVFLTWRRLAGSLPGGLRRMSGLTGGKAFIAMDREVDKAAVGAVWLKDPRVAAMVRDALVCGECQHHYYVLQAWVIMPNHVHVLLDSKAELRVILHWLKGSTARKINLLLGRSGTNLWQDESFDYRVRNDHEFYRIIRYIEYNPVTAGLVRNPKDWPWSSAAASENIQPWR